jgi:hypothetical protein
VQDRSCHHTRAPRIPTDLPVGVGPHRYISNHSEAGRSHSRSQPPQARRASEFSARGRDSASAWPSRRSPRRCWPRSPTATSARRRRQRRGFTPGRAARQRRRASADRSGWRAGRRRIAPARRPARDDRARGAVRGGRARDRLFVSDDRADAPRVAPPVPAHGCTPPASGDRAHVSADRRGVSIAAAAPPASST